MPDEALARFARELRALKMRHFEGKCKTLSEARRTKNAGKEKPITEGSLSQAFVERLAKQRSDRSPKCASACPPSVSWPGQKHAASACRPAWSRVPIRLPKLLLHFKGTTAWPSIHSWRSKQAANTKSTSEQGGCKVFGQLPIDCGLYALVHQFPAKKSRVATLRQAVPWGGTEPL